MLGILLIILIALWFLGYGPIEVINVPLFSVGREVVTLWDLLIFSIIVWVLTILPSPFRQIGIVLLIIWVLSLFGFIIATSFSGMIILAIVIGLAFYLLSGLG